MTLKEQLNDLREKSRGRIPKEAQEIIYRLVEDLRKSGAVERACKVGDRAPDWTLPSDAGQAVSLKETLAQGPVVLSFYRGRW